MNLKWHNLILKESGQEKMAFRGVETKEEESSLESTAPTNQRITSWELKENLEVV